MAPHNLTSYICLIAVDFFTSIEQYCVSDHVHRNHLYLPQKDQFVGHLYAIRISVWMYTICYIKYNDYT